MTIEKTFYSYRKMYGFALIATISIMVLIVMIALAMLSLSTIELRQTENSNYEVQARSNARIALMMAIAQLQKYAGPDQRVTAESTILEKPALSSSPVEKIPNRHWVGVWRSDGFKGEPEDGSAQPIIYRDEASGGAQAGSLMDRRATQGDYDKKEQVLTWLVSSQNQPDPTVALPKNQNTIEIVSSGSVLKDSERVNVFRIPLINGKKKESGGYAWWVGDEGVKARFNLSNKTAETSAHFAWLTPSQEGISIIKEYKDYNSVSNAKLSKMTSRLSSDFLFGNPATNDARKARRLHFHNLTFSSMGLITNTMSGGLRKDLSAFFNSTSGDISDLRVGPLVRKGLSLNTPILDSEKIRLLSPQFGLLYKWNQIGMQRASSKTPIAPSIPKGNAKAMNWGWDQYPPNGLRYRYSISGIDLTKQDTPPIHPVMIEAGISYGVSLKRMGLVSGTEGEDDAVGKYEVFVHYFPRVVLWNPYNVPIKKEEYVVQIFMPHDFFIIIKTPEGEVPIIFTTSSSNNTNSGHFVANNGGNTFRNIYHRPYFLLSSTSFEPGESLLFTADAGSSPHGNKLWGNTGDADIYSKPQPLEAFTLSANLKPPLHGNFYFKLNHHNTHGYSYITIKDSLVKNERVRYTIGSNANDKGGGNGYYKHYMYQLFLRKNKNSVNFNDVKAFPPLQYVNQNENGSEASNAPFYNSLAKKVPMVSLRPLRTLDNPHGIYPCDRYKWGHRLQWMEETDGNNLTIGRYNHPFLDYNIIANHNPRAGWLFVSPVENLFRASSAEGRYTNGILIDDPYGWDWMDGSLDPVPVKGKNRVSPFGRASLYGGQTFPLLDLPSKNAPLMSLASFQHAPLSQFVWHPLYAVGNSLADARVPRYQSTHFIDSTIWDKLGIHHFFDSQGDSLWKRLRQSHLYPNLNYSTFLYDLSYEINFALWDSYYLSSIPKEGNQQSILPNARMCIMDSSSPDELRDFHKSAKHIQIKGAFNINSTSEIAWTSFIASLRDSGGMKIKLHDGTILNANDVYSRFFQPYKEKYNSQNDKAEQTWKGYRQLTDQQIHELAHEMVKEVKLRGPFISIADFVNRRLVKPPEKSGEETDFTRTGLKGALQAALDRTTINKTLRDLFPIPKKEYDMGELPGWTQASYGEIYPDVTKPLVSYEQRKRGRKPDHNHWADSKMVGVPAYLTQADLLQKWGSLISARSDTFIVRAYGDAKDAVGHIRAKAWCEAIVQRISEPIVPDAFDIDPEKDLKNHPDAVFGRKFKIINFRWLTPKEI